MRRSLQAVDKAIKLLADPLFIGKHKLVANAFTRVRKLTFGSIIALLVRLCRRSLQIECNLLGDCLNMESSPPSKQAFTQARYKISYTGFEALHEEVLSSYYTDYDKGLWRGFRLLGIDGSTCRLPESSETEEFFGRWARGGGDRPGKQPVMGRISEVIDLSLGIIISGRISPWRTSEHVLAHEQVPEVVEKMRRWKQDRLLFVFDRGYLSKSFIDQIKELDSDFLFRVPRSFNKNIDAIVEKGELDTVMELYPGGPLGRVLVKTLSSGEISVLLTSLTNSDLYPIDEIFEVYRLRWTGLEESYKQQKIALELENFIGKSKLAVLQEFWATILAATLTAMHCVDLEGERSISMPHKYRINRSVVMGSMREDVLKVLMKEIGLEEFQKKFDRIALRSKVRVVEGRSFSREKVGKPKRHPSYPRVC